MPILSSRYQAPFWLRNPHVNTIWPVLFRRMNIPAEEAFSCRKVRLDTQDGDFLDVDSYSPRPSMQERGF